MAKIVVSLFRGLIGVVFALANAGASMAEPHKLSLDDMMKVEGLGRAASDPTGHWFVYERLRPYGQLPDYTFGAYAFRKSGHQLWRYDLDKGGDAALLPGLDQEFYNYLQGFSPSGRFLALFQYRFGAISIAAYDMIREKSVVFDQTPALSRSGEHDPVWISKDELVFAALPKGEQPISTSVRAYTGKALTLAWDNAWRGRIATADEVRSTFEDQSNEQEVGVLVRANARTGKVKTLARGLFADLRVSPDTRYLAGLAVSKPRSADSSKLIVADSRRYRLTVFDLNTGEARPVAPKIEFFPYSIAWAPDSERVAAFGWASSEGPRSGGFYVIDVKNGAATRYDHKGLDLVSERERGWLQRPERTAFLGNNLLVFARRIPENERQDPRFTFQNTWPTNLSKPDWYLLRPDGTSENLSKDLPGISGIPVGAGDGHVTVWAENGVYRFYENGSRLLLTPEIPGRFRFVSADSFTSRSGLIRPEFEEKALFTVNNAGSKKTVMVDLRNGHEGDVVIVDAPSADAAPMAGSLAAGAVLFDVEEGSVSRLLVARAEDQRRPHTIASVNTHLAEVDLGAWKTVSYEIDDPQGILPSHVVESCVLLPPGYDGEVLPAIVNVYPGVEPSCTSEPPKISYPDPYSPYLWAGKGYAYARLATPRQLIRTNDGPIAGLDEVIEAGANALVKAGITAPERMVLDGSSQGGVSALYVAAHSNRFKGVIARNSWADFFSHYFGAQGIARYEYGEEYFNTSALRYDSISGSDFGIGRQPFEDPEVYYKNSPVFLAPQIDMPVLLIHSDMDFFDISQFDEMFGALKRSGKDVRYVRYWGEGHLLSSPANIRDMWERTDAFLKDNGVTP
ncbi:hypothetical protein CW354_14130 [Marinicaulis flavus]|uniref:Peptidase S9 prolyl oligopeptidase catalytic domain-containing protein n=1 Tax=Hyphococcus luteus TaxID=2058213 RepID=A0A2S7K3U5_9PROT|nr:hypothetical protein CW354_14130 [Marinicaulis flavus]